MKQSEADALVKLIQSFSTERDGHAAPALASLRRPTEEKGNGKIVMETKGEPPAPGSKVFDGDVERLYQAFKARLIDETKFDPVLLHLLTVRPELVVDVETRTVTLDGSTLKGRVARLMAAGWFATVRKTYGVRQELSRIGSDPGGGGTLGATLNDYVRDGFLVREGDGYVLAPAVKVTERELRTQ